MEGVILIVGVLISLALRDIADAIRERAEGVAAQVEPEFREDH